MLRYTSRMSNSGRVICWGRLLTPVEASTLTGVSVEDLSAQHSIYMVGDSPRFMAVELLGIESELPSGAAESLPNQRRMA